MDWCIRGPLATGQENFPCAGDIMSQCWRTESWRCRVDVIIKTNDQNNTAAQEMVSNVLMIITKVPTTPVDILWITVKQIVHEQLLLFLYNVLCLPFRTQIVNDINILDGKNTWEVYFVAQKETSLILHRKSRNSQRSNYAKKIRLASCHYFLKKNEMFWNNKLVAKIAFSTNEITLISKIIRCFTQNGVMRELLTYLNNPRPFLDDSGVIAPYSTTPHLQK